MSETPNKKNIMEKETSEQLELNPAPDCENVFVSNIKDHEDSKNCIPSEDEMVDSCSNNTIYDTSPGKSSHSLTEGSSQIDSSLASPSTKISDDGSSLVLETDDTTLILDSDKHFTRQPSNELLFLKPVSPKTPEVFSSLNDKESISNADENAVSGKNVDMKLGDSLSMVTDRSKLKPLKDRIAK